MINRLLTRKTSALWRGIYLALILTLAAGCQGVNRLREAQDAFNQAATSEMSTVFGTGVTVSESIGTDAVSRWANGRNHYGSALVSLSKIDGKDERVLREEKLWGAKLTLEALCYWKLGNYEKALRTAQLAQEMDQLFPRDKAVMQALPGLIMIDYAFDLRPTAEIAKRESETSTNETIRHARRTELTNIVNKIEELTVTKPKGAIEVIESARSLNLIEGSHPVHIYLIQAQLAAYRNFRKGYELIDQTGVATNHFAHTNSQSRLDDLAKRVSGASGQALVNRWAELDMLTPRSVAQ